MAAPPVVCYGTRPEISAPISAGVCDGTVSSNRVDLSHQPISKRTRNSYSGGGEFLILRGKYTEDYGDFGTSTYYTDGSDVRPSPPSIKASRVSASASTSDRKRRPRKSAKDSKSRGVYGSIQTKPIIIEDADTTGDSQTSVETDATISRGMPTTGGVKKVVQAKPTTTNNTAATGAVHKSVQTESASPNRAATNAAAWSPGQFTAISIDGYAFDVPADPVECFNKVRQEVIAAYRAVAAGRATAADLAVVMGNTISEG